MRAGVARYPFRNAGRDHHLSGMKLELTDAEAEALVEELSGTINYARFPLSHRIQMLRAILGKLKPEPAQPAASPAPKIYEPSEQGPLPSTRMKPYRGPPATLGSTAAAGARIVVWCRACGHQVEPAAAEMAAHYGAETTIHEWHKRLVCSRCGGREVDFVLTGAG